MIAFMRDPASTEFLEDLRFALDVMEERSHLGLDGETASTLRNALLHRIAATENSLSRRPTAAVVFAMEEELLA
jgi:hypothetical protein